MENKILELLNNVVDNIDDEIIAKAEKEVVKCNVNKNNSISYMVYKNILLKITIQKSKMFLEIRKLDNINLEELKEKFEMISYKENDIYLKIYINDIDEIKLLNRELEEIYKYLYFNEPIETFGCCSRYEECSDALKCISPYKKIAKGCQYKNNLEAGKIFYGKNKNI